MEDEHKLKNILICSIVPHLYTCCLGNLHTGTTTSLFVVWYLTCTLAVLATFILVLPVCSMVSHLYTCCLGNLHTGTTTSLFVIWYLTCTLAVLVPFILVLPVCLLYGISPVHLLSWHPSYWYCQSVCCMVSPAGD